MTTKKTDTGKVRGNQTPNTPDVDDTKLHREGWKGVDAGRMPGHESERKRK